MGRFKASSMTLVKMFSLLCKACTKKKQIGDNGISEARRGRLDSKKQNQEKRDTNAVHHLNMWLLYGWFGLTP